MCARTRLLNLGLSFLGIFAFTCAALAAPPSHQVRPGDTLAAIAQRTGCTVAELRSLNGLKGDLIRPGQVLRLPARSGSATAAPRQGLPPIAPDPWTPPIGDPFARPQRVIDNIEQARWHYGSDVGGAVPAGPSVLREIQGGPDMRSYLAGLEVRLMSDLKKQPDNLTRGVLKSSASGRRGWNCNVMGSYSMNIEWSGHWQATPWNDGARTLAAEVTVDFTFADPWDFKRNPEYTLLENDAKEHLPHFLAGNGTPFYITGRFTRKVTATVVQTQGKKESLKEYVERMRDKVNARMQELMQQQQGRR